MDPSSVPRELLALALALALAVIALQALRAAWRGWRARRRLFARFATASEGERRAAAWLEDLGFEVIGAQVTAEYPVRVDDVVFTARVRADYLVRRAGLSYVVEVKTGAVAPSVRAPATRRQLLEYRVAFAVDGVLLVDAEQGVVHAVEFPGGVGVSPKGPVARRAA